MRVNVYAEEMTDRIEIITKEIDGQQFEAIRFYLYLPVTVPAKGSYIDGEPADQIQGPFIHREGDDDSAAVTFWSRGKLRETLQKAIDLLDEHHAKKNSVSPIEGKMSMTKPFGGIISEWGLLGKSIVGTLLMKASNPTPGQGPMMAHSIRTSDVIRIYSERGATFAETQNSTYMLV